MRGGGRIKGGFEYEEKVDFFGAILNKESHDRGWGGAEDRRPHLFSPINVHILLGTFHLTYLFSFHYEMDGKGYS